MHLRSKHPALAKRHQVGTKSALSHEQTTVLDAARTGMTLVGLMQTLGRTDRTKFRTGILKPMIATGFLELTIPDKPNSRLQKYRLTEKGRQTLQGPTGGNSLVQPENLL